MSKLNFYCNKGSMSKDAIGFALYCIENNIDVMNISDKEYTKHKIEYDKKYYTRNGWHPTLKDEGMKNEKTNNCFDNNKPVTDNSDISR